MFNVHCECVYIKCTSVISLKIYLCLSTSHSSSDMSGASNTLAREFLTDVHQLCSVVAQLTETHRKQEEEESHMVALGEYLVQGRGFLLLSTLDAVLDQVS